MTQITVFQRIQIARKLYAVFEHSDPKPTIPFRDSAISEYYQYLRFNEFFQKKVVHLHGFLRTILPRNFWHYNYNWQFSDLESEHDLSICKLYRLQKSHLVFSKNILNGILNFGSLCSIIWTFYCEFIEGLAPFRVVLKWPSAGMVYNTPHLYAGSFLARVENYGGV